LTVSGAGPEVEGYRSARTYRVQTGVPHQQHARALLP